MSLDIDVTAGQHDVEACHRIGLFGKNKPKKPIIRLVNRRYAEKALINKKILDSIDNAKYYFDGRTKIFINDNLSPANESITYNCRKLRRTKIIDSCYSRDGIICTKGTANSKLREIHHMKELWDLFPDFFFQMMRKTYHMLSMMLLIYVVILQQFSGYINNSLFQVDIALGNCKICLVHYEDNRFM